MRVAALALPWPVTCGVVVQEWDDSSYGVRPFQVHSASVSA